MSKGQFGYAGVYNASPVTLQDGQGTALAVDQNGYLKVDVVVDNLTVSQNIAQLGGFPINLGAGNTGTGTQRVVIATDQIAIPVSGTITANQGTSPWVVGGSVASGAADSGNPVKIGGVYNSTMPTLTNGQRGNLQLSSRSELQVNSADSSTTGTITAADAVVAAPAGSGATVTGASTTGSLVALACPGGDSSWIMQVSGTLGGSTFYFEGSLDSTNGTDGSWINVNGRQTGIVNTVLAGNTTVASIFRGNTSGWTWIRMRAVGGSAISATVKIEISSGTGAIFLNASIPAGTNAIGSVTVSGGNKTNNNAAPGATNIGVLPAIANAAVQTWTEGNLVALSTPLNGALRIDHASLAGTIIVNGGVAGLLGTAGNIAHDGVDTANPLKVGMRAVSIGSNPTDVSAADRTDWLAMRNGVPIVLGGAPNIVTVAAEYTSAQTNTAIVTISTGSKIVVTACEVTLSNANTVNTGWYVGLATATTPTTSQVLNTHPKGAAGSGVMVGNGSGIIGMGADNEDIRITSDAPTTGALRVRISYFTITG